MFAWGICLVRTPVVKNAAQTDAAEGTASDFLLNSANQRLQRALQGHGSMMVLVRPCNAVKSCAMLIRMTSELRMTATLIGENEDGSSKRKRSSKKGRKGDSCYLKKL